MTDTQPSGKLDDSHEACAHTVFHNGLLLVRGTIQRRDGSTSLVGTAAWPLDELAQLRRDGGLDAVAAHLTGRPLPTPVEDTDIAQAKAADNETDPAAGQDREGQPAAHELGRTIKLETGYDLHPWADLQPPGERTASARKLWTSSPGSAGR